MFLPGFLVVMAGLIIAGPWLTMVGARLLARRTSRPATLIAARRLADNPRAGFRSVSGLILALFVTSVAVGVIGTIVDQRGAPPDGPATSNMSLYLPKDASPARQALRSQLTGIPGVGGVVTVYERPRDWPIIDIGGWYAEGLARCSELAQHPDFGHCAPGAQVAAVFSDLTFHTPTAAADRVWPTATTTLDELAALPTYSVVVGTDGSASALERARTVLATGYPRERYAGTEAEWRAENANTLVGWQQLANVVILVSLTIAGCSLAVSVVGGITERKRPFSLLRLAGAALPVLRRVVLLESAVPLLAAAVVAVGVGFLAANLFLQAQMQYTLSPPGVGYYVLVIAGLVAALGIIAATLPLLRRVTGPETVRND